MRHGQVRQGLVCGGQRGAWRDVAAGVKAAVCVVMAAHAPANGRDTTPVLRQEWGSMRTRRATARSSVMRRQAMSQQQPACRAARCGAGTGASRGHRTACRHGRSRGRAR